jgi:hypothetical protein
MKRGELELEMNQVEIGVYYVRTSLLLMAEPISVEWETISLGFWGDKQEKKAFFTIYFDAKRCKSSFRKVQKIHQLGIIDRCSFVLLGSKRSSGPMIFVYFT